MNNQPLSESVFLLQEDGSVYHLGLKPGELAETVVLVGDPDRVGMVSAYFDEVELVKQQREFVTHTGYFSGQRLSVVSTGIGTSNVDIVLNEIDALHNIDFTSRQAKPEPVSLNLIRIGTCGSLDPEVEPGAAIVSQYAAGFDGALNHYALPTNGQSDSFQQTVRRVFQDWPMHSAVYGAVADPSWVQKLSGLGVAGITLTCSGFYAAQHREWRLPLCDQSVFSYIDQLIFNDARVKNFEMETAMLLGLGGFLGHRCASVSLAVVNRITEKALAHPKAAMHDFIGRVLNLVC